MMKLTARAGGYSSVVGQSVLVQDPTGRVVCQLALLNVGGEDHKQKCAEITELIVESINRDDPDLSGYVNNLHSIEVLARVQKHLARARKGAFFDKTACDILSRAIAEQTGRVDPSMVAYKIKDSRGEYWQTTVEGNPYNFSVAPDRYVPAPARWINRDEREPTVGGSYMTGSWVEEEGMPAAFIHTSGSFMIMQDGQPTWFTTRKDALGHNERTFPQYWLEGIPGAPTR